ncbi:glycosyltransferase family 2 protein [Myxococcus llanfairpwllgwyngyllgogerychwyrndrobwllllantysiliogogogochensis]|uniref:Glycosyltransferase family 2 protein n=1 Tax=Myxococcus llanfairpwllgwyngyllgogerychwyrndrobwllllantysiliogogogochensis TaxID=2590453 RepID=A0A540X870_9BACT|nr:glycosyltransferase [Myxococcus llanfairpwllgwyngyllgogerychwyrndrobwllllantysiliogogogochensis]TQF17503.1 glycosyltransferase family 2 protein [Myxococcus llanfairpwllgwyngyllgogerychwyrndrobwllllantysiliogogogochensis]
MTPRPGCSALIATRNRWELLFGRALPSIRLQTRAVREVVIVNDGASFTAEQQAALRWLLHPLPLVMLDNQRANGAAGAWNTGLAHLLASSSEGFVALLDDDDSWESSHVAENLRAAEREQADIVVSGLRLVMDGQERERALPEGLIPSDFLVGNPGWQGSNTFVSRRLWATVRGFRDGLRSLNDRDLAIRLLRAQGSRVAYTGQWTATWHLSTQGDALSSPRSPAKISGLRWFWRLYGGELSEAQAKAFFARAECLFGVRRTEIEAGGEDVPPHQLPWGDLHETG